MIKRIVWANEDKNEIIITKTEDVEQSTTLAFRERDLEMARAQVVKAQQTVDTLEAELAEIKLALNIPDTPEKV